MFQKVIGHDSTKSQSVLKIATLCNLFRSTITFSETSCKEWLFSVQVEILLNQSDNFLKHSSCKKLNVEAIFWMFSPLFFENDEKFRDDFSVYFWTISSKPLNLSLKVSKTITSRLKQYCTENRSFWDTTTYFSSSFQYICRNNDWILFNFRRARRGLERLWLKKSKIEPSFLRPKTSHRITKINVFQK